MPIPTTINDISTTASLNYPKGNNNISLTDDYLRQIQAILRTFYDAQTTTNSSVASDITTLEGLVELLDSKSLPFATTTGTSSAYLASLGTGVVSVNDGSAYILKFHTACAANPTLQVNGLLPILDIKLPRSDGTLAPVAAGDIGANDILLGVVNEAGTSFIVVPNIERTNVTYLSTATTLTVESALDMNFVCTATATHTLPLLSTFIVGGSFVMSTNSPCTIQRQDSDLILVGGVDLPSINLNAGEKVYWVKSASKWLAIVERSSIGFGQTWQNVLASRASATLYANSTGLPIIVTGSSAPGTSVVVTIEVGGNTLFTVTPANGGNAPFNFLVPPDATYRITSTSAFQQWRELR